MSSIHIKKISITDVDTDCVVNAANSSLAAGGGVCGFIFKAAGYAELTSACEEIGHCDTGSAVITPGFAMKSKYIIHAVGPIWNGGRNNEEKLLYSCYQRSMELVMENDCHSIAFPLISAGIYGYPKEEAWKVAIKSVNDFLSAHPDYDIDVIFAVLDNEILAMGNKIFSSLKTDSDNNFVFFYHEYEENGYLSNWYKSDFIINGNKYCCNEQYMMEQKALLFGDTEIAEKIMRETDPMTIKTLGKAATGFNEKVWNGNKQIIMFRGLMAKFTQNVELREKLISTGNAVLVEASPKDRVWGIALSAGDPDALDMNKWKGENLLGFALMAVRAELK